MHRPRDQANRHRATHRRRVLLKHPRRRKCRLRRDITRRDKLLKAGIRVNETVHRPRRRDKMREVDILSPGRRRRRSEDGILQHVRRGRGLGWTGGRGLVVAALHLADDEGYPVGDVVAAWGEVEQEGSDLVD